MGDWFSGMVGARRWRASAMLIAGLVLGGLVGGTSSVVAVIHPRDASIRTTEVPLDTTVDFGIGKGTARCPAGQRAISGGAALHRQDEGPTADINAKLIGSAPLSSGKGWRGAAESFQDGETVFLRITVVCLPRAVLDGYTVKWKDLGPASGTTLVGSKGCGKSRRLLTGGVWWDGSPINGAENVLRSTPSQNGKRWSAAGFTYGVSQRMRMVVVCLPASGLGSVTVRARDFADAGAVGGTVTCPRRQRALAGGASWRTAGADSLNGTLQGSSVTRSDRGWFVGGQNNGDIDVELRVRVTCIRK